jgi:CheY-like chemotaxis protein
MESSANAPATSQHPPRVLIVEDEVDSAWTMAALMEQLGCETRIATDGTDAIPKAFEFHPRIVLLDLGLPTMDGYQVAQLLRQAPELSSVLIIAITGYGAPEDKQKAYQFGIDLHLTKPVKVNFLKELISVYGQQ